MVIFPDQLHVPRDARHDDTLEHTVLIYERRSVNRGTPAAA